MVMAGRSVHLLLGKLEQADNQHFVHILNFVTDNKVSKGAKIINRYNQVPLTATLLELISGREENDRRN